MEKLINSFNKNYNFFNFICGITSIYFLCEILKSLFFTNTTNIHYNTCIELVSQNIRMQDVLKICQYLNNITTYQTSFHNLFLSILIISNLLDLNKKVNYKYWIMSHLSALVYTYIGKFEMFQFSIDSYTKYDMSKIIILTIVGTILLIGIIKNLIHKKIQYKYIINYVICYLILFLLHIFISNDIIYHFHHSLVCIFVSYFFSDWSSIFNYFIHSILLGIIVQGLNFYYLNEFSMFYISNELYPKVYELLQIYAILGIVYIVIFLIKLYNKKRDSEHNELEIPLLIPTQEELNYNH